MSNKALWQILDTIEDNYEDIDIYELEIDIKSKMGEDYIVGVWDHEDYELCDLPETIVEWISNNTKGKVVVDLQADTFETKDDEGFFSVVALKTKEV